MLEQHQASGEAERIIPFWIFDGFAVTATEPVIRNLAARQDIREIRLDKQIPLPAFSPSAAGPAPTDSEWNIAFIRAPEVWSLNPAYNGTGAVVGSFDTGVDLTHPDLYPRYRGNNQISWFDPYGEHNFPFDANGHGTHTTGIAVGGNAGGTGIGVAPGATWIAAKGWSDAGIALASVFHQIFQWFLAPGGDPDNAPDVINNSWVSDESGCDAEFLPDVAALLAAGIFPVFGAGNDGPDAGTVRSPASYPNAFAVGATDYFDQVAYFSSQGPSPCDNSIKPNISAPGDGINSAVPGGYEVLSGTSMATPHITGAVAVLRSINPSLTVEEIESALTAGAKDLADPGPDNSSGAGRLDLFVSAQIAIMGPAVPVVNVVATQATATEAGSNPGVFTISRIGNTDADLLVKYTVAGTATAGSDYAALSGSVNIPAGSAATTIQVVPIDDAVVELDETVILTISPDPSYIVSGTDAATMTIISDEPVPDLVISALSVPAIAGAGQPITVTETTRNQTGGISDPTVTKFFLSANATLDAADVLIGSRNVPALGPGAGSSASTTVTIPTLTGSGTWYLIAQADANAVMTETSETNNISSRSIRIGADLVVSSVTAPGTAGAGQSISVTDTTKNQGGGSAEVSVTKFYLSSNSSLDASDVLIGSRNVPPLGAGTSSSASTTVTIPQQTATGSWYLIAKADADGAVPETYETNNSSYRTIQIGADLVISAMTVPGTGSPGQSAAVSDTTKNQGGSAAGASVTKFYLSSNSALDVSDILIGSRDVPALGGGASSTASTTVTIPEGTATGLWYIIAKADADAAVSETFESNNSSFRTIRIGADLVISAMTVPATASAGQSVAVSDTTKNQGGGGAGTSVTKFYLSSNSALDATDLLIGSRDVPALGAGTSITASTVVAIPPQTGTGTWYVIAKADADSAVTETSETNNISFRTIQIGADLLVSAMTVPGTAGAGQSISVTDTTRNQGGAGAEATVTKFYLSSNSALDVSDVLIGSRDVPALGAGTSSTVSTTVTIPAGTSTGLWYLIAKADAEDGVSETFETNNTSYRTIQIGPDLAISSLSIPSAAIAGQSISMTDTTRNQGGGGADASVTRFYLSSNSTLDASDVLIGSRDVPALGGGTSSTASTTVTIPPETAARVWYIIAVADGGSVVRETSENNNTNYRTIQISPSLK